jgi:hypothetical protein
MQAMYKTDYQDSAYKSVTPKRVQGTPNSTRDRVIASKQTASLVDKNKPATPRPTPKSSKASASWESSPPDGSIVPSDLRNKKKKLSRTLLVLLDIYSNKTAQKNVPHDK